MVKTTSDIFGPQILINAAEKAEAEVYKYSNKVSTFEI